MKSPADYLRQARELEAQTPPPRRCAVAVLSTFSAEFLRPYLTVESHELGFPAQPWFAPFGQLEQMVLNAESPLWQQQPEIIWIALRVEDVDRYLSLEMPEIGPAKTAERLTALRSRLVSLAMAARQRFTGSLLISNLATPSLFPADLFDASQSDGWHYLLSDCNRNLARDVAQISDAHIFDYAGIVSQAGAEEWVDPKLWYLGRIDCRRENQPILANRVARAMTALRRPAAKCLVLDLDNTLWGGVLGDDGPEGIKLGDDYPGNVFKDFQAALLGLRRRGFLLAISSKNNPETVEDVLDSHPEIILRREHFACIRANWDDKPSNIREIAKSLNIGLDSLIFIDDNPVERAMVRAELPQVHVVEMPADPLQYLNALHAVALLDRPRILSEDRDRAEMVQADSQRRDIEQQAISIEDFLASLQMEAGVGIANSQTMERIHQLIQKTNQFNLTTRRHSLDDVRRWLDSPDARVAWLRLRDKFGDLGLVCVGIVRRTAGTVWEIDTLLMSCRVMGRRVEQAFLSYLAELAGAAGATALCGVYRPTAKSTPVANFYAEHGFQPVGIAGDEETFTTELSADRFPWPVLIHRSLPPQES